MRIVLESLAVLTASLILSAGVLLAKGLPALPAPPTEATSCGGDEAPVNGAVQWVTQEDAHAMLNDDTVVFVDARPAGAFEAGHVAGALHVPMDDGTVSDAHLAMLRAPRTIITYCDTGDGCARSATLAGLLTAAGLRDVRVLQGGLPGWNAHGFAAEAGPCKECR